MSEPAHLRVYRFEPGVVFEGGLLAAIERMELLGDAKLLDVLFVTRDAESGALEAVDRASAGADSTVASVLDFRLDPGRRRAVTERTLADHPGGVPGTLIEAIAGTLAAGAAIFAVLYTGSDPTTLGDAVARYRGRLIADERVDATALGPLGPRLHNAAASTAPRP